MSLLVCQSSHRMKENISDRHREGSASGTGVKEKYNTEYSFFLLLFVTSELIIWNIIAIHSICEGLLIHIVLKTIHERSLCVEYDRNHRLYIFLILLRRVIEIQKTIVLTLVTYYHANRQRVTDAMRIN